METITTTKDHAFENGDTILFIDAKGNERKAKIKVTTSANTFEVKEKKKVKHLIAIIKGMGKALAILAGLPFIMIGFYKEFFMDMIEFGVNWYDITWDFLNDR